MNGEWVTQAEFSTMLWPKLFLGVFLVIGIVMIVIGIRKIWCNSTTARYGRETHGIVIDVYPSGSRINGRPILNASVAIIEEDGSIGEYVESIGMSYTKYRPGYFVKVKHYNGDINILETVEPGMVPYGLKEKLEMNSGFGQQDYNYGFRNDIENTRTSDTIAINGVEYERKR